MSYHQALKQSCLAIGALAFMLAGSGSLSYGGLGGGLGGCSPATPCHCAADGICRPQPNFGHSKTRWRPWPGEQADPQLTVDPSVSEKDSESGFGRHQLPKPSEEGLRGPVREKREKKQAAAEGAEAPLPGGDELPLFDPQGSHFPLPNNFPLPNAEDAPPPLPKSLRQAAQLMPSLRLVKLALSQTQPLPAQAQQPLGKNSLGKSSVRPVHFQQASSIQLINPASAILTSSEVAPLQQAIYYEAKE